MKRLKAGLILGICIFMLFGLTTLVSGEDLGKLQTIAASSKTVAVPGKINVTLVEHTPVCMDCYSIYKVCKQGELTTDEAQFGLLFKNQFLTGITKSYQVEVLQLVNKSETIIDYELTEIRQECKGDITTNKDYVYCDGRQFIPTDVHYTIEDKTVIYNQSLVAGSHKIYRPSYEYVAADLSSISNSVLQSPAKACWYVKISSTLQPNEKVDNIVQLANKDFKEFAWWNASYAYRSFINCSSMAANMPTVINGTTGFTLPGSSVAQIVWFTCQPQAYIYYNNFSSYAIANETSILPFDVEKGNISSYSPYTMWNNTGVSAAYLFNSISPSVNDSAGRDDNLDTANSPTLATGLMGNGMQIIDTQKAQSVNHLSPSLNFGFNNWSILYYSKKLGGTTNIFIVQKYTFGVRGYYCGSDGDVDKMYMGIYGSTSLQMAGNRTLQQDRWYQHVCTRERAGADDWIRIYINGTIDNTKTDTGTHNASESLPFYIQGGPANAVMDSVLLFNNRLLSPSEIQAQYNNVYLIPGYGNVQGLESAPVSAINITYVHMTPQIASIQDNIQCEAVATGSCSVHNMTFTFSNQSGTIIVYNEFNKANNSAVSNALLSGSFNIANIITCSVQASCDGDSSAIRTNTSLVYGMVFNNSNPANINSTNIFSQPYNTTYRYYLEGWINSSILLFYKTNNSLTDTSYYINGSAYSGYASRNYRLNVTNDYTWTVGDNEIYGGLASYNVNEATMEQTTHVSVCTLDSSNDYCYIGLINLSQIKNGQYPYVFFEVMANATSPISIPIYVCNSNYTTGNIATSVWCAQFSSIVNSSLYDHRHSIYASHHIISVPINSTTNKIGGTNVELTDATYFMLRGITGPDADVWGINQPSRATALRFSGNGGNAVTDLGATQTADSHIHFIRNDTTFYQYACGNVSSTQICSSLRSDSIDLVPLPPTTPVVLTPSEGIYARKQYINWTASTSITGTVLYYNITLVNSTDLTQQLFFLYNVPTSNLSVSFCPVSYNLNNVTAAVGAFTNESFYVVGYGQSLFLNYSVVISPYRNYAAILTPQVVTIGCNFSQSPDTPIVNAVFKRDLCTGSNTTSTEALVSNSISSSFDGSVCTNEYLTWSCNTGATGNDACATANESETFKIFFDSAGPTISMEAPTADQFLNYSYSAVKNISINYTVYDIGGLDQCWFNTTATPLPGCANFTLILPFGIHTISVYVNDTLGRISSVNHTVYIVKNPDLNISFSNYETSLGFNWTRVLNISIRYNCDPNLVAGSDSVQIRRLTPAGVIYTNASPVCDFTDHENMVTTQNLIETNATYYAAFEYASYPAYNVNSSFGTFQFDIFNPTLSWLDIKTVDGFVSNDVYLNMSCIDSIYPFIEYNETYNAVQVVFANYTNNTYVANITTGIDGVNTQVAFCCDLFGCGNLSSNRTIYSKNLILINEITGALFDVNNVSGAKVYVDDNSTYYDFKANATSNVSYTTLLVDKLRFELLYADGSIITRYVDVSLVNTPIRVCANTEGVTHYTQLLVSSSQRPVVVKSAFADCLIAADYTRFVYQNSYVLKAFSIPFQYNIFVWDTNGVSYKLASMDGSISDYHQIDSIEFRQTQYPVSILGESITTRRNGTLIYIFYNNLGDDNTAVVMNISRASDGLSIVSTASFASPNQWTYTFNASPYLLTNLTLFKVQVTSTDANGPKTITRYFNNLGVSGVIRSEVSAIIAILALLFGLTFAATSKTFGWFGGFICILNIVWLSFALSAWYITFLIGINIVIIFFFISMSLNKIYPSVG